MKSEIHIIAEAILANTMVLKMLVEKLPAAAQAEVAKVVNPTPVEMSVTTVPAVESPVTIPVTVTVSPVVSAPNVPAPTPVAPAPVAPAPVVAAPATVSPSKCPFVDQKGLITYVMDAYKQMGQQKGAKIQGVLDSLGIKNINEVKSELYQGLYDGVEALRNV